MHNTLEKLIMCQRQAVTPVLEPETKVLYSGKVCRIGCRNSINSEHVRCYLVSSRDEDTHEGFDESFGFVPEYDFQELK